jgi:hypothetical protein
MRGREEQNPFLQECIVFDKNNKSHFLVIVKNKGGQFGRHHSLGKCLLMKHKA